jgi:hypothetical protein
MYIIHLFNKMQLELNVMDPIIADIISNKMKFLDGKHLVMLIRLITRNGSQNNKFQL